MTRRIDDLTDPAWERLFTSIQASWFRLETQQTYDVDYEAEEFRVFQQTGRIDREPQAWQQMITAHVRAGRHLQRVHVVNEPLSAYLRYELAAYEHNAKAGEEIRLIPAQHDTWPDELIGAEDFWLFDDSDAWVMHYDDQGRFQAAEQLTDPAAIQRCRDLRSAALARSIKLSDYRSRAA